MNALLILAIGVVVAAMIIVLRLDAFIALITAAIVVSLLAPGELSEKVTRHGNLPRDSGLPPNMLGEVYR